MEASMAMLNSLPTYNLLNAKNHCLDCLLGITALSVTSSHFYTDCSYFNTVYEVQVGSHGFVFGDKKKTSKL